MVGAVNTMSLGAVTKLTLTPHLLSCLVDIFWFNTSYYDRTLVDSLTDAFGDHVFQFT